MGLQAFLFDMDGVIVDNHPFHEKAWQAFCQKHGITLTSQQYKAHINGRTVTDVTRYIFQGQTLTEAQVHAYSQEKEALYRQLYHAHLAPTPGLSAFLQLAQAQPLPMAVATSAPTENVTFTLDGLQLRNAFEAVIDSSMISKGKPDPEIYLKAAQALQVPPESCIVFEDAISGIQAGRAAGCKVVGLATTHTANEIEHLCHAVYTNFENMQLLQLQDLFK